MNHKEKIIIFSVIFYVLFFIFNISFTYSKAIDLYFFWGSGCSHCANMAQVLKEISAQYPELKINTFEVWYNSNNQKLLAVMAEAYNFKPEGVPVIFIGDQVIERDGQTEIIQLKEAVRICSISSCVSPIEKIKTVSSKTINFKNIFLFGAGLIIFLIIIFKLFKKKKKTGD